MLIQIDMFSVKALFVSCVVCESSLIKDSGRFKLLIVKCFFI